MKDGENLEESPGRGKLNLQEPHLKDYFRVLLVRRWTLITVFFLTVCGAAVFVFTQTPMYRATALVLIEPSDLNLTDFKSIYNPTVGTELSKQTFMQTQYELILNRPCLEKVFLRFHFGEKEEFRELKDPISAFKSYFSVNPIRKTRLAEVSFDWKDPELATKVVDFHVKEYLNDYRQRRLGVSKEGYDTLVKQVEELKPKVEERAQALQQFMARNNMVSLDKTQDIIVERMKAINKNLIEAETERIVTETRYRDIKEAVESSRPLEQMPEIIASNTIRDLKQEYMRTKQEYSDLGNRFGPNHPEVQAVEARFISIAEKIRAEIDMVLSSAEAEYDRASRQEAEHMEALAEQERKVIEYNEKAVEYNLLNEHYDTLKQTYRTLTKRIEEIQIGIATGTKEDNIFIISPPRVPVKPVKPRKGMTLALAALIGMILGAGLCYFLEYLDTTIKTKDEVEKLLDTPVMGYVPAILEAQDHKEGNGKRPIELLSLDEPNSAVAEAFRSIRTALMFSDAGKGLKSLLLTSSVPMEGKTLISVNLAIALAKSNKKILLVDADMRKPRLTRVLSPESMHGLSSLLINVPGVRLETAIQPTDLDTFHILPCGPVPPNPAELLGSERMTQVLNEMSDRYDAIVFDTPPVISATDATVLAQKVQGAILVVRAFTTQRDLARRARDILTSARGNLVGTILNSVDVPRGGQYGYGGYYYGYQYTYGNPKSPKKGRGGRKRDILSFAPEQPVEGAEPEREEVT